MIIITFSIVVVVIEAGELKVTEMMRLQDIIGEPGATYYGIIKNERRFLRLEPIEPPAAIPPEQEDDDSGIEVGSARGIDVIDGRRSRRSNQPVPVPLDMDEFNLEY